ncbi:glycosyl transferase group 1 [Catenulispora acidiphila DSM 44928]|uniref:Glycosyl transferase group 1 n=1 Tax=Catenulispora acidiphila (strain DSM 44928 / JCM 14897 / NBRC 102108 / NRRL B-24433 / ID139908) TaxID=479433 RepID=C7PWG9_CATAD|nr:glycosyltransferase family 4 protein [Catenulispora acidiphila]ACU75249.1 glycosyl transferase group 1 [Catenulispora acidiphila DSM 44928]
MSEAAAGPLKVLLVSHYYPPHMGGIENVVHSEARYLTAAGVQVTVLTSGERSSVTDEDGVRVVRVRAWNGLERKAGVPFPILGPKLLRRALRWARWADVVHIHDAFYQTSWAALTAAKLTGTPTVATQHVALVHHDSAAVGLVQKAVYASAGRLLMRTARTVLTMNSDVAAFVRGLGARPERIRHLPNGTDTALFRPVRDAAEQAAERERLGLPAEGVLVLFVGRFVPKKGFDLLLAAQDPGYHLVFAGGPAEALSGAGDSAIYLGSLSPADVAAAYRACDVFALPSTSEGFPLTVQEAMSSGLAVVTTDDSGYAAYDLDRDRVSLVDRDTETLRVRLREIAADSELRRQMGKYAREYAVECFAWPDHASKLIETYRSAIRPGTSSADRG